MPYAGVFPCGNAVSLRQTASENMAPGDYHRTQNKGGIYRPGVCPPPGSHPKHGLEDSTSSCGSRRSEKRKKASRRGENGRCLHWRQAQGQTGARICRESAFFLEKLRAAYRTRPVPARRARRAVSSLPPLSIRKACSAPWRNRLFMLASITSSFFQANSIRKQPHAAPPPVFSPPRRPHTRPGAPGTRPGKFPARPDAACVGWSAGSRQGPRPSDAAFPSWR